MICETINTYETVIWILFGLIILLKILLWRFYWKINRLESLILKLTH